MMKILHIAFLSNKSGGIESVILNWNREIDSEKFHFDFATSTEYTIFEEELSSHGGRVFYLPSAIKHPFQYKKRLAELMRINNYDAVHIHKNSLSNSLVIYIVKQIGCPRIILHSHNTSATGGHQWIKNVLHYINFYPVKKIVNDQIACSEVAAEWMFGKKAVREQKVQYLKNGVDITKFQYKEEIRQKQRRELNIRKEELTVGYVARFTKEKNHDFLIDIFKEILRKKKNAKLLLVGGGGLEAKIRSKVKAYGIEENVIFKGNCTEVNELYQAMDCFVMPSFHEGLPLVGIEAQISGLPCIFSEGITKETAILESAVYLNLDLGAEKWADMILSLSHKDRGQAYEKMALAGYDIKQTVARLQEIYEKGKFIVP